MQPTLDFLRELAQNNNKAWFDANRKRYEAARSAFETLVADLIEALRDMDHLGNLTPKECMFRINRDVRFAKDKSPYNAHMSAQIANGGRHGEGRGYYLHFMPDNGSFLASGLYEPEPAALDNIRQHLVQDAEPLRKIIAAPDFKRYFGALSGDSLKTAPSGYDRTHPNIDLIRYKQFLAVHNLADSALVSDGLVAHVVAVRNAMQPFLDYLDKAAAAPPKKDRKIAAKA
jgi:uncharacterized protein (TIGR02453 family)